MFSLSKRIPIHVWGGLGSQLFAVALILDLKQKIFSRQLSLELHTGGVTSRLSEIDTIFPELQKRQIRDFADESKRSSRPDKFFPVFKLQILKIAAHVANYLGLVNRCNTDKEFQKLKPWILTIRGHYAYRSISASTLLVFSNRLTDDESSERVSKELDDSLAIHYRLGDLLTLDDKNPIDVNRIGFEVQRIVDTHSPSKILCFSDTPQLASELLQSFTLGTPFESKNLPALSVINEAYRSRFFVGSNSKISFWIVCLRLFRRPISHNSLPSGSKVNWIHCADRDLEYSRVVEY